MSDQDIDELEMEVSALESVMGDAAAMAARFTRELEAAEGAMGGTAATLSGLEGGFSRGLRRAFDGLVLDGMKLSDALSVVGRSMVDTVYAAAVNPVTRHVGGLLADGVNSIFAGAVPNANGAGFAEGRVMPFARGGVVSGPTFFPMRGGLGLMGEAGPEAIMPLARGIDGRLGVRSQGGAAPVNVTINVTTPDVAGFRRSQSQIAAEMSRALGRGQRNR